MSLVALAGIITYSLLYAGTTWLGALASEPPPPRIRVHGSSVEQRVAWTVEQVREHYPNFLVDVEGLSSEGVTISVGWRDSHQPPLSDGYAEEIASRVEDSREATIVLLQAIARSNPTIQNLSAYEDRIFIPVWSRHQILGADPSKLRSFDKYTEFVFSARTRSGYAAMFRNAAWE